MEFDFCKISNMFNGSLEVISIIYLIEVVVSQTILGTRAFFHDIVACEYVVRGCVFFFGFGFYDGDRWHMVVFLFVSWHAE
jgi:hypothetical protein